MARAQFGDVGEIMAAAINPVRGEDCHNAKLTEADAALILQCVAERERLRLEAAKLSNYALAEKFNVHVRTIERVTQRRGWIHV